MRFYVYLAGGYAIHFAVAVGVRIKFPSVSLFLSLGFFRDFLNIPLLYRSSTDVVTWWERGRFIYSCG